MEKQTAGRENLGELAPKFAQLNDDVLFGEVWSREDKLSLRDRSMITISALMANGLFPQLKSHLIIGKKHGITKEEVVEVITQLAFYSGWPKAWSAFALVNEVYEDENVKELHGGAFGMGEPNTAFAKYFKGNSYLNPLTKQGESAVFLANVTFEPGCRNNWHIHHATSGGGQILICVDGEGWYMEEGKLAKSLRTGDVVVIPANVKHWHGAKKNSWFSHIAIEVPGENTSNEWCEEVSDEEYDRLGGIK
ncbi:MAG: carboxymuconolactone decarboxylase family protein [Clostridia bacterium]|nr:carboxymuconolactone decarboxylase family protein [Clostridia bacterium]